MPKLAKLTGQHLGLRLNPLEISARLAITAVFCPGSKKGTVLLEEKNLKKGNFCSRNYILRALSHAELFSEGTLHKLWATQPICEM